MAFWIAIISIASSIFFTGLLRRYALQRNVLDIPNSRSSHSVPTPRGGGLAIVLGFLISLGLMRSFDLIDNAFFLASFLAGITVAALGFLDDHGHIPARWRLLGHFLSAIWAVYWIGGLPSVTIFGLHVNLGWIGGALAVLYAVWMLNLYNFMDGIDGLASAEAICACSSAALIYWMLGYEELLWPPIYLALATAGFFYWNFPKARIFMGDAGSGFLGITLAIISLKAASFSSTLLWVWLILLGVFIVDATFTLMRRLLRGEKVYEAHRSHAYQYASRRFNAHVPVTLCVILINLVWLAPIAWLVAFDRIDGAVGMLIAYVPLVVLALKFKAGVKE
ncbi:glycosyltransferase family 4 protein [Pseudomonas sp. P867]|uniref:MraY family glycosyltransferase n=1 Tax=unclassified Pseudomonas TaxID=196821 RepID=UPI001CA6E5DB|nr:MULTISPECIES: glycosyltransferase family 4 protein [unclassified Pseudomonas]MBY8972585.1 glycosyltransferase family 4 protein [Pseudomonas sp. P867]MCK3849741.1 glycosyltransferase family 4 protein [Pseudomonas sp. W2Jun17]UEH10087.1 glycosyltransferase family 4 protein [Pseudomonas sp. HN8-3]